MNHLKKIAGTGFALLTVLCVLTITACSNPSGDPGSPPPPPTAGQSSTHALNGISVRFRYVPAGSFQRDDTAENVSVITKSYWMSETEVTQELFYAVMGTNPSYFTSGAASGETQNKRPVENVSWYAAIAFCNKLSLANGKDPVYSVSGVDWTTLVYNDIPTSNNGDWNAATWDKSKNGYRLPTEMEWMWAAMGADTSEQPNVTGYTKGYAGSSEGGGGQTNIGDYAWYDTNSDNKTHEVGKKTANELGLKDMSGNVWEWCWDRHNNSYPAEKQTDYAGAASGVGRVIRGGGWQHNASTCVVSYRGAHAPGVGDHYSGFRVVCR
jgi:formylglycine-generating enzyme required for sulfatase activity